VPEIVKRLEQIAMRIKPQVNQELTEQALVVLQEIVATHSDTVTRKSRQQSGQEQPAHIPQTPAEQLLQRVYDLAYLAEDDAWLQSETDGRLQSAVHCGRECPYPDVCSRDSGGDYRHSWHPLSCVLYMLSLVNPAHGWKKLVGCSVQHADNAFLLSRIKQSFYYRPSHNSCLRCIGRPGNLLQKGCTYTKGRKCLLRIEAQEWMREQKRISQRRMIDHA
jgi:hypothetical protein